NARFCRPILESLKVRKVVIVTSWYHAGRALRIFQHEMPKMKFEVAFEPEPEDTSSDPNHMAVREKLAVWHTTLRHRIWCLW
ncbi:MAG: ElyC/SanA/YdcF family protein, partial [Verrucomicrobiales bacterium]